MVWCLPRYVCTLMQRELKELHSEIRESAASKLVLLIKLDFKSSCQSQ